MVMLEAVKISSIAVDGTAPETALSISSGTISTSTLFSLTAQDPIVGGIASGLQSTQISTDGGAFAGFAGAFVFTSTGTHTLQWFSQDNVGNREVTRSTMVVVQSLPASGDQVPPVTTIQFSTTPYLAAGPVYISATTQIIFTAQDFGTPASGVALTQYAFDNPPFKTYDAPFVLKENTHSVSFRTRDHAGNWEVIQSTAISVDATPPDSELTFDEPSIKIRGLLVISTYTPVQISAVDPQAHGVRTGEKDPGVEIDPKPCCLFPGETLPP